MTYNVLSGTISLYTTTTTIIQQIEYTLARYLLYDCCFYSVALVSSNDETCCALLHKWCFSNQSVYQSQSAVEVATVFYLTVSYYLPAKLLGTN